jgi:cytochrome c peroxidase
MTPSWPMFHGALALGALAVITLTADQALMAEVGPAPARSTELAEPIAPIPTSRAWDPRRVALGQRLFHEVRLSRDGARSCATCHPLDRGGMDGRTRPFTTDGQLHGRNTPTIFGCFGSCSPSSGQSCWARRSTSSADDVARCGTGAAPAWIPSVGPPAAATPRPRGGWAAV